MVCLGGKALFVSALPLDWISEGDGASVLTVELYQKCRMGNDELSGCLKKTPSMRYWKGSGIWGKCVSSEVKGARYRWAGPCGDCHRGPWPFRRGARLQGDDRHMQLALEGSRGASRPDPSDPRTNFSLGGLRALRTPWAVSVHCSCRWVGIDPFFFGQESEGGCSSRGGPPTEASPEALVTAQATLDAQLLTLYTSPPPRPAVGIFTYHSDPTLTLTKHRR